VVTYKPSSQEILDRKSYGHGSRARFDPQWAMSRPTDWYTQSYDTGKSKIRNIDLIKDTLVRQPAVTTDQNESRNMYQMLMNQIKGGGGAQLLDTSGLPAGARRTGRTLFTDPAKSQGFFGDVGSLFTGKNKAAVRAPVHNVFGNFGQQGKDWYKKEFPGASAFSGIMSAAENFMPGVSWAKRLLPKKKRKVIPRDPRFLPENNRGPLWELLEEVDQSPGTAWYGPYNEDWEKLQSYLRGDIERDEDIERIFFDTQPPIIEETDEMDEFMSGNIGILNPLQPNDIFEESETIDITDGAEEEIITETVEKNPWIMRIFGNDVKGLRGYLWDLGIINPNSDMYQKTDQLEQPE